MILYLLGMHIMEYRIMDSNPSVFESKNQSCSEYIFVFEINLH